MSLIENTIHEWIKTMSEKLKSGHPQEPILSWNARVLDQVLNQLANKYIDYLSTEECEWATSNGGDTWKTTPVMCGFLVTYYQKREEFKHVPYEIFKRVVLSSLLTPYDILHLWNELRNVPREGKYLEVGSFVGGSLILAHVATRDDKVVELIAIDPHVHNDPEHLKRNTTAEETFKRNTKDIPHRYYKNRSADVAGEFPDKSIDLVFIDGGHLYEECSLDLYNYWPKVKQSGVMLVHDYNTEKGVGGAFPGVVQAVDEFAKVNDFTFTQFPQSTLVKFGKI